MDVGAATTDYFDLMTREWESEVDYILCEQDVVPALELLEEMWACDQEWCSAFFWVYEGAVADGEVKPVRPRRYRVSDTLACIKFSGDLLARAHGAMRDAAARTNGRRHYNMLDLALVAPGGVLQSWPYNAVPHIHGPIDHRPPPSWVQAIPDSDWNS